MVSYEQFLTTDPLDNYEDSEKYKSFLPKLEKYRKSLENALLPEYKIELPDSIENLIKTQFNPLNYLYKSNLLNEKEFAITDSTARLLLKKIALGELTSVEVFKAFAKRATIAHQFTNCAMDMFMEEGLERAKFLDEYLSKNGKTVGPLHGLPISLKEQIGFKNRITHASFVSLIDNVPSEHALTNQILEDLGVVFYIRTTQPQTIMHLDSQNNFLGLSRNPHNLSLSSGGSSSGEGSVVGFGGSPLGIGTDIGGSIRVPAAYSGCYGLRPTTKRLSLAGGVSAGAGQESVLAVQGPLARSIDDIELFMDIYINHGQPWIKDASVVPMPWRKVESPKPDTLKVAILYDDGLVKPTPPVIRGLQQVADKLSKAGAKVVEFKPIETRLAYETVNKMFTCDGNNAQRRLLSASGEPLAKLTRWTLNRGEGAKPLTITENRALNVIREQIKNKYNAYLVKNDIDFIISPSYNNVAPKSEHVYNWSYTSIFNLIDFPTLAFQTGLFQDPNIDQWNESHKTYKYRDNLEELELENYNPQDFVGAPIGLQLTGRRYFDEEVVAAGKTITDVLGVNVFDTYQ